MAVSNNNDKSRVCGSLINIFPIVKQSMANGFCRAKFVVVTRCNWIQINISNNLRLNAIVSSCFWKLNYYVGLLWLYTGCRTIRSKTSRNKRKKFQFSFVNFASTMFAPTFLVKIYSFLRLGISEDNNPTTHWICQFRIYLRQWN